MTGLDVSHNTKLTGLYIGYNRLLALDLTHNTKLKSLYANHNSLTTLDLIHNTELDDLCVDHNNLSSLDLAHNTELESLYVDHNKLTSLDLTHNTDLLGFDGGEQQARREATKRADGVYSMALDDATFDPCKTKYRPDGFDGFTRTESD